MKDVGAPTYENRRFSRVQAIRPATIASSDGQTTLAKIVDVSICGVRFAPVRPVPVGSECVIRFHFEDEEIEVHAIVVRIDESFVSAEITGIKDGCYGNLRKILVESTDEPGTIDTELIARDNFVPQSY